MKYKIKESYIEIEDKEDLIPDKSILDKVIGEHPFCSDLYCHIKELKVKPNESEIEKIEYDSKYQIVTLYLFGKNSMRGVATSDTSGYQYILYHELSHVADKINPEFKYSDEKMEIIYDEGNKGKVDVLWDTFIDTRLNAKGLFQISHRMSSRTTINGERIEVPKSIVGALLIKQSNLEKHGIGHEKAKYLIHEVWNNPNHFLTYDDLINISTK